MNRRELIKAVAITKGVEDNETVTASPSSAEDQDYSPDDAIYIRVVESAAGEPPLWLIMPRNKRPRRIPRIV